MENEKLEVLEEMATNETGTVSRRPLKGAIIGIAAAGTIGLLLAFRKKIAVKIEKSRVKKLEKKGYLVISPIKDDEFQEKIEDESNK